MKHKQDHYNHRLRLSKFHSLLYFISELIYYNLLNIILQIINILLNSHIKKNC